MWLTIVSTAIFAAIHLWVGRLSVLDRVPRSRWLSFAGGVAVCYVFVHVLPELAEHSDSWDSEPAARIAYLVALAGLAVFYGLERAIKVSRDRHRMRHASDQPQAFAFWLHIASFAAYNLMIGYLTASREQTGTTADFFYVAAMALHFLTNDFGLRHDYKQAYDHTARWLLVVSVATGALLGLVQDVPETAVSVLFAFLAGGIVLNVLKEELPEERQSRFWPFAAGAAGYAVLLVVSQSP